MIGAGGQRNSRGHDPPLPSYEGMANHSFAIAGSASSRMQSGLPIARRRELIHHGSAMESSHPPESCSGGFSALRFSAGQRFVFLYLANRRIPGDRRRDLRLREHAVGGTAVNSA